MIISALKCATITYNMSTCSSWHGKANSEGLELITLPSHAWFRKCLWQSPACLSPPLDGLWPLALASLSPLPVTPLPTEPSLLGWLATIGEEARKVHARIQDHFESKLNMKLKFQFWFYHSDASCEVSFGSILHRLFNWTCFAHVNLRFKNFNVQFQYWKFDLKNMRRVRYRSRALFILFSVDVFWSFMFIAFKISKFQFSTSAFMTCDATCEVLFRSA